MIPAEVHLLRGLNALERALIQLQGDKPADAARSIEEGMQHVRKALD